MILRGKLYPILILSLALIPLSAPAAPADDDTTSEEYQAGFYYTVKPGDTLWDISARFADSPWQWPRLWHGNRQITNPHWIYPGQRIRIYQKSWIGEVVPREEATPIAAEAMPSEPETDFFSYPAIDSIGYIRKDPIRPTGSVLRAEDDQEMISQGDRVYVRPADDRSFLSGERYTVYRTFSNIRDPEGKGDIGTQYYLTGVIQITDVESRFAVGTVVKSYRSIHANDSLTEYLSRSSEIPRNESHPRLVGSIIGAEDHTSIIGDNAIAFINRGSGDGVLPGQVYRVFYEDRLQFGRRRSGRDPRLAVDFGEILVLHAEETTSTVLVTRSDRSIYPGAKVHAVSP